MNYMNATNIRDLRKYTRLGIQTEVESASQHRLIQMLLEGALSRIIRAKSCIKNHDVQKKGEFIGMAISIIGGLRDSLDHKAGAEVAKNLDRLYEYMSTRLLEANVNNDMSILDEVHGLLTEIKSAWDAIGKPPLNKPPLHAQRTNVIHKQAV